MPRYKKSRPGLRPDFVWFLTDFDQFLAVRRPQYQRAAGARPDNFSALRQFLSLPAPKVPSTPFSIWQFLFRSPPAKWKKCKNYDITNVFCKKRLYFLFLLYFCTAKRMPILVITSHRIDDNQTVIQYQLRAKTCGITQKMQCLLQRKFHKQLTFRLL